MPRNLILDADQASFDPAHDEIVIDLDAETDLVLLPPYPHDWMFDAQPRTRTSETMPIPRMTNYETVFGPSDEGVS